ncbi:MAG: fumarylacetoacetate hydrolase family protein [Bacillota bacterium]|jgi:2-keto-4-pentenoate hydratase/2-oxohepta-3-ene-1,7-dioic acid hydratase in catechol pathway
MKKYARINYEGKICFALMSEDERWHLLDGNDPCSFSDTGIIVEKPSIQLIPCTPTKIVGVGLNYMDMKLKQGESFPRRPKMYIKPLSALIGDGEDIILSPMVHDPYSEVELAVVISRYCSRVSQEDAEKYIWGYMLANDMTASDLQKEDIVWGRAKTFDTFCPVSQYIISDVDVSDLEISTRINGKLGQHGSTKDMLRKIPWLISYISYVYALQPGDLLLTGTPTGYGDKVNAGDLLEMEIENIGKMHNKVKAADYSCEF